MSPVVGLIGKKRAGKDTLAASFIERHGFRRFAFADPLKRAALNLDPWVFIEADECYLFPRSLPCPAVRRLSTIVEEIGWESAKEIREIRRILQDFGVTIREIQEDFWVAATLDPALHTAHVEDVPVVVTDVRFPNEADEIRNAGGTLVRIVRPGQDTSDSHASETALDDYEEDFTVWNDSTLEALARNATLIVREC